DDAELTPRPLESLVDGMNAAVDRHGYVGERGWRGSAGVAVQTVRALRRRELFRIACADLLDLLPSPDGTTVVQVGQALSDVTDATLGAALRAAEGRVRAYDLPFTI